MQAMVNEARLNISTHALREEGDPQYFFFANAVCYFYPRPPRGGRLMRRRPSSGGRSISTHALREEGDAWGGRPPGDMIYFYPRPPRGGRPASPGGG